MTDLLGRDTEARSESVRPDGPFIVQAPAGSGKTSLLTQRFLRLLAEVERPEEIVAITFTRKAAAEMRHRIVTALAAAGEPLPDDAGDHERLTRDLARAALSNGRQRGWDLAHQPSRLHIQTIDGLNHWLAARLPLSARLGLSPQLLDDARLLYGEAAQRFVARLEEEDSLASHIAQLARLLDHDPAQLQALLADMLGRREIWLPKLYELMAAGDLRSGMERLLAGACETALSRIAGILDVPVFRGIVLCLREAANRDPQGPLAPLATGSGLPACRLEQRESWECIARCVLTGEGKVRTRLDKRVGFPPGMKSEKADLLARLAELALDTSLVTALDEINRLPPARYEDAQWERVAALIEVLVPAAAELQALFAERALADHAAVAAAARLALGEEDAPSELALALDYRIRHLLVDEYQDTSPVQQRLLQRLVAGWQPGDGHSLFCVGDPMQSIYGFREADVTLFLEAQQQGLGDVPLQRRSLSRNFRSCRSVVEWINEAFARVMPSEADYQRGAVPYTDSAATREDEPRAGVKVHAVLGRDEQLEVQAVMDAIEESLADIDALRSAGDEEPRNIAVLVRARTSLPPLLAELRRRGIEYRGVELESLGERAAVRDVLALARGLLHPGDRTAWLAILRAPWCGLTLSDLHALAAEDSRALPLSLLQRADCLERLSPDARQRVGRLLPVLLAARQDQGRQALGSWVRACWVALGGPATLEDEADLDNVENCFAALDALAIEAGPVPAATQIESAVDGLMASPTGSEEARVQLMTIHKAKGLEFDTVVLPALGKTVAGNSRQLLYWTQVAVEDALRGIVLASRGDGTDGRRGDALESWMRRLEGDRSELELGRLAYVAATRARRRLHLVGAVGLDHDDDGCAVVAAPRKNSMLHLLWPVLQQDFETALQRNPATAEGVPDPGRPRRSAPPARRLPLAFDGPPAPAAIRPSALRRTRIAAEPVRPQFEWAGAEAIAVGTVVHAELERLGSRGKPARSLTRKPDAWADALRRLGLPPPRLPGAVARVAEALDQVAQSGTAAHLLDPSAREAASELDLTAWLDGEFVTVKIDRTFVDEAGVRWIVDWKTGSHEGGDVEQFLEQEIERYAAQLERYSRVMSLYDGRPQQVGLYFPLLDRWKAWTP
jgi:ATP-dependent exoDNAse (exonuclease V) beta subunit